MQCKAKYRRKDSSNPFVQTSFLDAIVYIKANFPNGTPTEEVERMAKRATPKGYEFVEVKKV